MTFNTIVFLEAETSFGDTMSRAGLNTLMGLGIVFLTLAFIACVIAIEGKIFTTIARKKAAPKTVEPKKEDTAAPVVEEVVEDSTAADEEIAAVIAAAIYAFESETGAAVPADALVVRSIRRLR
ncbi:MAG: OadG family protein [Lachnospiraceae bacterium]|nr:OadG family protein [Lachnospiraceae bacterium]